MFFSIAFSDLFVVAHSQWKDPGIGGKLRIFTSREVAKDFMDTLSKDEAESLGRHLSILKESSMEVPVVEIDGDAAATLSHAIATCANEGTLYFAVIFTGPTLIRFLEPPKNRKDSSGIIMWFDPDDGYHAVIVYSKEQAECAIQELLWLGEKEQKLRLRKIRQWGIIRRSSREPQKIGGSPAQLLCLTAAMRKKLEERRAGLH